MHVDVCTQGADLGWRHHILVSEDEATGGLSEGVEEVEQEGLEVKCTEMKVLLGTVGNTHAHGSTPRESSW